MRLIRLLARRTLILAPARPGYARRRWRDPANPYQGSMADGWNAFHAGEPDPGHPWKSFGRGRAHAYSKGWHHARLATQQGKRAL